MLTLGKQKSPAKRTRMHPHGVPDLPEESKLRFEVEEELHLSSTDSIGSAFVSRAV